MSEPRERGSKAPPAWRGFARWSLRGALGAGLLVGAAWCWDALLDAEALALRTVYLHGGFARATQAEVFERVRPHLGQGFLRLDLDAVRADVEALPWIAQATVRREWPGTLRVALVEEQPVAVWQGSGLLNAAGERFADGAAADLPALDGPAGSAPLVLATYRDMQRVLGDAAPRLTRLALSERRAWEVGFADGTRVLLGRRDALARLDRFAAVAAPLVGPQADHVAYVDMRYANGFSVGWKAAPAAASAPPRAAARPEKRKRTDV